MRAELICHALDWDLSAADVLRLVRDDPHPVALLGAWAGGSDIIASSPAATAADPFGSAPEGARHASNARFGGGWIGYFGYGASGRFLPVPPAPGNPRRLPVSWWGYYDHVLRRDRATGQWFFEAVTAGDADQARRTVLERRARSRRRRRGAGPPRRTRSSRRAGGPRAVTATGAPALRVRCLLPDPVGGRAPGGGPPDRG